MRLQLVLGFLDLREHLIEGVGEEVEFVGARGCRAHGVVVPLCHRPRRVGQRKNGLQQPVLEPTGDQKGERQREGGDQGADERVELHARIHGIEIRLHVQEAKLFGAFRDGFKADQCGAAEGKALADLRRQPVQLKPLRVSGEYLAANVVERGGHDVRIGFESGQNARRILRIFERQRRRAIACDGPAQNLQLLNAGLTEGQKLIGAKRRRGHQQDHAA